jgi:hypothetical protein
MLAFPPKTISPELNTNTLSGRLRLMAVRAGDGVELGGSGGRGCDNWWSELERKMRGVGEPVFSISLFPFCGVWGMNPEAGVGVSKGGEGSGIAGLAGVMGPGSRILWDGDGERGRGREPEGVIGLDPETSTL